MMGTIKIKGRCQILRLMKETDEYYVFRHYYTPKHLNEIKHIEIPFYINSNRWKAAYEIQKAYEKK